jgi:epoxyqueuosine reductase
VVCSASKFNMKQIPIRNAQFVKQKALELGFFYCGISNADFLQEEAPRLEAWLKANMHGKMAYMENYFDKRLDPRLLVDGAKSVISLGLNYFPEQELHSPDSPKLSKYAYGEDYHTVIKDKLTDLMHWISEEIGEVNGRIFVDSAPVLDKTWAVKSGMGWMGKHTNVISREQGSFFFIAELIVDLELEPDGPIKDYCGTCTRCIDACPTDAIVAPYLVDGSKCISYLTIELKDEILPREFAGKMDNWMFGCDVCQDVCPWNRFAKPTKEMRFAPSEQLKGMTAGDWRDLTQEVFSALFKLSAVKRTKFKGLKRNIDFLDKK